MNSPKVSIIVPCYKVEQYLDRCINSIVCQTLQDIEVILIDDGSPDCVPRICDDWSKRDSRIKVIHKQNEGLGMACNSGLDLVQGKYVAFIDSDDWIDQEMYEELFNLAEKYEAQMVFSGIKRVDSNGNSKLLYQAKSLNIYNTQEKIHTLCLDMIASEPSSPIERKIPMSAKIVLYKYGFIKKNNIRFENERQFISEDLLFNLDCLVKATSVVEMPKTYYNYFINSGSLTANKLIDRFPKNKIIYYELIRRCAQYGIINSAKQRVERMFIGYCRHDITSYCKTNATLSNKIQSIKKMCYDTIWCEIVNNYPIKVMPLKHKIFMMLLVHKMPLLIYLLSILK